MQISRLGLLVRRNKKTMEEEVHHSKVIKESINRTRVETMLPLLFLIRKNLILKIGPRYIKSDEVT